VLVEHWPALPDGAGDFEAAAHSQVLDVGSNPYKQQHPSQSGCARSSPVLHWYELLEQVLTPDGAGEAEAKTQSQSEPAV
jgi:hypothetical protein